MFHTSTSTCHEWPQKGAVWTVWTPQIEQFDVFAPSLSLSLFNSLQVSWQPCLVFWQQSLECWCQLSEGREGGGWRDWKREGRGRSERAIQGTCPLSPSEHRGGGGAHALRETHSHIGVTATFSQPAPQTDSSKRIERQRDRVSDTDKQERHPQSGEKKGDFPRICTFVPF